MKKFSTTEILEAEFECTEEMIKFYNEVNPPKSYDDVKDLRHAIESFHKACNILMDKLLDKEIEELIKEDK